MFGGETLLARTARIALESKAAPVVVVLGAHAEECAAAMAGQPVRMVKNSAWREGIASSIRAGVASLTEEVDAVVILLCDQPGVSPALIDRLITATRDIAACEYGGTTGPPVCFAKKYFKELLALEGEKGAKSLLSKYADILETVPFPGGEWDVDLPDDRKRLVE